MSGESNFTDFIQHLESLARELLLVILVQRLLPESVLREGHLRADHLAGPLLLDSGQGEGLDVPVTDVWSLKVGGQGLLLYHGSVLEAEESGGAGDGAHTVVGDAGVSSQTTRPVLPGHQAVDVALLQLHPVLVPGEGGLGHSDHLALQVDGPLLGQDGSQRLQELGLLVVLGDDNFENTAGTDVMARVFRSNRPLSLEKENISCLENVCTLTLSPHLLAWPW